MTRGSKAMLLAVFGLTVYLIGESFHPAEVQPTARFLGAAIDAYQSVGSPAARTMGVRCRYTPTCSHYAEEAVAHYGTLGGSLRAAGRLWRCSPWGGTGYDPAVALLAHSGPQQETPEEKKAREDLERQIREQQKKSAEDFKKGMEDFKKAMDQAPEGAAEAAGMGIACCIISVVGSLIGLAIWVIIVVWVYKDAKARGDQNAVLWIILCVVLGWIGLIVYVVARPKGDLVPCANCKNKMMTTLAKCPHCGTDTGGAAAPPPKA